VPELLWLYLTALLYYRTSASCVALAEALPTVSHDRLTRMLQAEWSGQTLLELAVRTLFVWGGSCWCSRRTICWGPLARIVRSGGGGWAWPRMGGRMRRNGRWSRWHGS
jgi:hypothetical protein